MLCKTYCATCIGLQVVTVTVEVFITPGIGIHIVGLPDVAVKESLLRVVTALSNFGFRVPGKKIVINLAPADIRKEGSAFDLSIAIALLCAMDQIPTTYLNDYVIMGELSLDGMIRPVTGALPVAIHAKENGFKGCIFPKDSATEASEISELEIYGVSNIGMVIEVLNGRADEEWRIKYRSDDCSERKRCVNDFSNVKGQKYAKRGLEIAAAGGHNLLLIGSPGCGKSLMASCFPSILPQMSREESLETSKIYSVAGELTGQHGLLRDRPFRTPHHSASQVSLIGGGTKATPGEISLAHNGVLYLDEIAQFGKNTLDLLRQPIEDGRITISRAKYRVDYPASFTLVASMNPCPCGYYGDKSGKCTCSQTAVTNYLARLSGPLMDRIDLHIWVDRVETDRLVDNGQEEPSEVIARKVEKARQIQLERFKNESIFTNSRMNVSLIEKYCRVGEQEKRFLATLIDKLHLSARAYSRILKLSRTIADLDGKEYIGMAHISEAVQFRNLDRFGIE